MEKRNERHVGIYVRVSTKKQDLKSQKPDLERWAESQDEPVRWYSDKFTGRSMKRPGMDKLMDGIRTGEVSQIVCWRLDRLGRTVSGLASLFEELQQLKVNFVSLKDGINLKTSAGRLIANVLASVAQYETEIRAERILAGQSVAKAAGVKWGGSVKGRRITVTQEQERTVKKLHREGQSISGIAKSVSLSRPTIYRLLGSS